MPRTVPADRPLSGQLRTVKPSTVTLSAATIIMSPPEGALYFRSRHDVPPVLGTRVRVAAVEHRPRFAAPRDTGDAAHQPFAVNARPDDHHVARI
jgi:hypothetical protein